VNGFAKMTTTRYEAVQSEKVGKPSGAYAKPSINNLKQLKEIILKIVNMS